MRTILFSLALIATPLFAQNPNAPLKAVFVGVSAGNGVAEDLADSYAYCLVDRLEKRKAFEFLSGPAVESVVPDGNCDNACIERVTRSTGADVAFSLELTAEATGFMVKGFVSYGKGAKTETVDWRIVGNAKALKGDGCLNGAGVIYNTATTPLKTTEVKLPAGYNPEKARDKGMDKGDTFELVEQKRDEASRSGKSSEKNPDSEKSGKTGR